jgi:hypothetical protein
MWNYIKGGFWLIVFIGCILFLLNGCSLLAGALLKPAPSTERIDVKERVEIVCPSGQVTSFAERLRKYGHEIALKCAPEDPMLAPAD